MYRTHHSELCVFYMKFKKISPSKTFNFSKNIFHVDIVRQIKSVEPLPYIKHFRQLTRKPVVKYDLRHEI